MTAERREEIFSQESLSIDDLAEIMNIAYSTAASLMRKIKGNKVKPGFDRLGIQGRLHVQDYIDYFNLPVERYVYKKESE